MSLASLKQIQRQIALEKAELAKTLAPQVRALNDQYIWQMAMERYYTTHGIELVKKKAMQRASVDEQAEINAILELTQKIQTQEYPNGIVSVDSFLPPEPKPSRFGYEQKLFDYAATLAGSEASIAESLRQRMNEALQQNKELSKGFRTEQNSAVAFYMKAQLAFGRQDKDEMFDAFTLIAERVPVSRAWRRQVLALPLVNGKTVVETMFEATDLIPIKQGELFGRLATTCPHDEEPLDWMRTLEGQIKNPALVKKWRVYENAMIGTILQLDNKASSPQRFGMKALNLQTIASLEVKDGGLVARDAMDTAYVFEVGTEKAKWIGDLIAERTTHFKLPDGRVMNSAAYNSIAYAGGALHLRNVLGEAEKIDMPAKQADAILKKAAKAPGMEIIGEGSVINRTQIASTRMNETGSLDLFFKNSAVRVPAAMANENYKFLMKLSQSDNFKTVTARQMVNLSAYESIKVGRDGLSFKARHRRGLFVGMPRGQAEAWAQSLEGDTPYFVMRHAITRLLSAINARALSVVSRDLVVFSFRTIWGQEKLFGRLSKTVKSLFSKAAKDGCWAVGSKAAYFCDGVTRARQGIGRTCFYNGKNKLEPLWGHASPDVLGRAFGVVPFGRDHFIKPQAYVAFKTDNGSVSATDLYGNTIRAKAPPSMSVRHMMGAAASGQRSFVMMKAGDKPEALARALVCGAAWEKTSPYASDARVLPYVITAALHFGASMSEPDYDPAAFGLSAATGPALDGEKAGEVKVATNYLGFDLTHHALTREGFTDRVRAFCVRHDGAAGYTAAVAGVCAAAPLTHHDKSNRTFWFDDLRQRIPVWQAGLSALVRRNRRPAQGPSASL